MNAHRAVGVDRELEAILAASVHPVFPTPPDISSVLRPKIRAACVLFDVYGTLFQSASGDVGTAARRTRTDSFARALSAAGLDLDGSDPAEVRDRYFREIARSHEAARRKGIDYPEIDIVQVWRSVLEAMLPDGGTRLSDDVVRRIAVRYEAAANPAYPMPGARAAIAALKRQGAVLGIVSNAQFYTKLMFPAFFGADLWELGFSEDLCVWSFELGRAKPSPDPFASVLGRLRSEYGVGAESVVYVGNDMRNDVWAAKACGCRAILFAGDVRSLRLREDDPSVRETRPDAVVRSLDELVAVVDVDPKNGSS